MKADVEKNRISAKVGRSCRTSAGFRRRNTPLRVQAESQKLKPENSSGTRILKNGSEEKNENESP